MFEVAFPTCYLYLFYAIYLIIKASIVSLMLNWWKNVNYLISLHINIIV